MARLFVSQTLAGLPGTLEEIDDGIWNLTFYHVLPGRLDEQTATLHSEPP